MISFLLPTIRSPINYADHVINNINSFHSEMSYEICIYSQQEIKGENVVWYQEPSETTGPIYGFNYMAQRCKGEYLICLVDDHILANSFEGVIHYLELQSHQRFRVTTLNASLSISPVKGQLMGDRTIDFDCPGYPTVNFPVIHRSTLERELDGVIFNSLLYYHAGDIWLGFYMGINGQPATISSTDITAFRPTKDSTHEVRDCNTVRFLMEKILKEKIPYNYCDL